MSTLTPSADAPPTGASPPTSVQGSFGLSTRTQIACAWAGIYLIVLVVGGWLVMTRFIPPMGANDSAQQIADHYRDNTDVIRAGLVIGFCGWAGWGALTAVIAVQMNRMHPKRPVLAMIQLISGAGGWIFLSAATIILIVASFRPERSPELTQTLHDLGWIMLFITVPIFSFQALVIGVATLKRDVARQVYPRWFGFLNIWVAILFVPALFLPFFKTGPFSWQGAAVYWLAFVVFFTWILAMWVVIRAAAKEELQEHVEAAAAQA
ncbi:hypothetical protein [Patulibacter minatonensis]|uniref:hypothetical protein n=1 Tax=Patulibacter minatonensis TaxID=298163 RepID=UPI000478CA9A|nr:hypothetical protein [Patulibacter minatonensis]